MNTTWIYDFRIRLYNFISMSWLGDSLAVHSSRRGNEETWVEKFRGWVKWIRITHINILPIRKMKFKYLARKISVSSALCLSSSPGQRRSRFTIENVLQKNRDRPVKLGFFRAKIRNNKSCSLLNYLQKKSMVTPL